MHLSARAVAAGEDDDADYFHLGLGDQEGGEGWQLFFHGGPADPAQRIDTEKYAVETEDGFMSYGGVASLSATDDAVDTSFHRPGGGRPAPARRPPTHRIGASNACRCNGSRLPGAVYPCVRDRVPPALRNSAPGTGRRRRVGRPLLGQTQAPWVNVQVVADPAGRLV